MFSLIITIISIALVAALALATIYYGGTAFNRGTAEAKASQLINEGQQINGAVAMLRADIDREGTLDKVNTTTLTGGIASQGNKPYLAQMPANWDLKNVVVTPAAGATPASVAIAAVDASKPATTAVFSGALGAPVAEAIARKAGLNANATVNGVVDTAEIDDGFANVYGVFTSVAAAGGNPATYGVFYKL